jgi:carbon monoxide dehydrogenase subunit G
MTRIHKSIEINAPVNKVFAYINNPENEHDWLPNMIEVKNVTGSGVGTHYEWTWKIGELRFNGESTRIENVPEKRIVVKSKGKHGIESKWTYNLNDKGDATIFDLDIEYIVPTRVLGKPVEKVIMERNKRETDLGLMNIKKRLEKEVQGLIL